MDGEIMGGFRDETAKSLDEETVGGDKYPRYAAKKKSSRKSSKIP